MEERIAVYTGTRNIYHHMAVSAKSLLAHNGADTVWFLIEDDTFPEELPPCIHTMNVSGQSFFRPDGPNYNCRWSYMVMMRMALAKLFPQCDRVLSLDHDTIVRQPIDLLWSIRTAADDYYYFAAVEEKQIQIRAKPYFNFGVLLHNLAKLRDGTADTIIGFLNTRRYDFCEQDAGNALCRNHILKLPPEYNAFPFNKPPVPEDSAVIKHYAAQGNRLNAFWDYRMYDAMPWERVLAMGKAETTCISTRHDVINAFISARGYRSFLEIGTDTGVSLSAVRAERIVSVDPDPSTPATHHMTSDAFFAQNAEKFDIVFIDGLHECNQVHRDIHNALRCLNKDGVIVLHDCLPTTERMQEHHTESQRYEWTGDVWKAFVKARTELPHLMFTIDTDYGCGIIDTKYGVIYLRGMKPQLPDDMDTMTYAQFTANRNDWMNIKSVMEVANFG